MPEIRVKGLTKTFKDVVAVDNLTFAFPEGRVTCLLGPSGCGKTTLLRMIAGLETPTAGSIYCGDRDFGRLPPRKRNIGMVFQYPVVYRGTSVYKNIELPLLRRKIPTAERKQRIGEVLELLSLGDQADKDCSQLDNVSRQKVAVARAISYRPDIILFDEPMTNIDANSRIQFSHFFKALSKKLNQVIIYVTHDQTEAMSLADQIALMEKGRIVQCDTPRSLYNTPESVFGGWFLGNPGMNFIQGRYRQVEEKNVVASPFLRFPLKVAVGGLDPDVTIGIRPEHVKLDAAAFENAVAAKVKHKALTTGGQLLYDVEVEDVQIKAKISNPAPGLRQAQSVWLELPVEHIVLFDQDHRRIHTQLSTYSS